MAILYRRSMDQHSRRHIVLEYASKRNLKLKAEQTFRKSQLCYHTEEMQVRQSTVEVLLSERFACYLKDS